MAASAGKYGMCYKNIELPPLANLHTFFGPTIVTQLEIMIIVGKFVKYTYLRMPGNKWRLLKNARNRYCYQILKKINGASQNVVVENHTNMR